MEQRTCRACELQSLALLAQTRQRQANLALRNAVERPLYLCQTLYAVPVLAVPLNAKIDLVKSKSEAVEFPTDETEPLQLNIFSKDSRHFDIVSEVSNKFELKHLAPCANCRRRVMQKGEVSYHLHKVKTFSPFAAAEWHLSDSVDTSPGTLIIKKAPFASHVSIERRDGSLIADMGPRLLMTGSEICWGGRVYR